LVRRRTNSIRRGAATSLLMQGEVRNSLVTLAWWVKRWPGSPRGWRRNGRKVWRSKRGDLHGRWLCRSQSPRSTAAVKAARGAGSKAAPREGRIGRWEREFHREAERKPSAGSVRKDYTRRRDPRPGLVVGGSFGVE